MQREKLFFGSKGKKNLERRVNPFAGARSKPAYQVIPSSNSICSFPFYHGMTFSQCQQVLRFFFSFLVGFCLFAELHRKGLQACKAALFFLLFLSVLIPSVTCHLFLSVCPKLFQFLFSCFYVICEWSEGMFSNDWPVCQLHNERKEGRVWHTKKTRRKVWPLSIHPGYDTG